MGTTAIDELDRPHRLTSAWYVWAVRHGQPIMLGKYLTEDEAYKDASMKLDCNFEVVELNTTDPRRAWKILRKRALDKTGNLDEIMRRAKHTAVKGGE